MKHIKLFEQFLIKEYQHDESVWVHIKWRGQHILCTLVKMGNKWYENQESGPKLPQFGRTHIGASAGDVVRNLKNRYESAEIITEDEALELI